MCKLQCNCTFVNIKQHDVIGVPAVDMLKPCHLGTQLERWFSVAELQVARAPPPLSWIEPAIHHVA